ncbi:hypothetical protein Afil01_08810 [Actinorhabdospora filicis]|uniref:Cell envelope-related transcriptional attenuator domain-containing protein n=1 Tax=Actinorhabdospora filicis TaxID=1785913 RepID=A0A9W6SIE6_9ACTN|nr:LCP family protein [Actinorhabdospora filicis]GLZ76074.1 hypothetical protein Afil01_08810 [Actinorhabdospora filicis]
MGRHKPRKSPLWARILVAFGAVVFAASAGAVVYVKVMVDKVNNAVGQECLLADCGSAEKAAENPLKGPLNLIMIGSDMRDSWDAAQSDTIMILHVNESLTAATILSIPRDLRVHIPRCYGGGPCTDKINASFTVGGKDMGESVKGLEGALTELTGLKFDGAAVVNFAGFEDVVDLLGGVELCVPFDMTLLHPQGKQVEKGCKLYTDTELALGIVRERYAYDTDNPNWDPKYGQGDYGRQRMQQHFIKQILKRAKEQGYLTNPLKVGELIQGIGDQITVSLGGYTAVDYAVALKGIDSSKLTTVKVPSQPQTIDGTSYVVSMPGEQETAAEALYKALREDTLDDWIVAHPQWLNKNI